MIISFIKVACSCFEFVVKSKTNVFNSYLYALKILPDILEPCLTSIIMEIALMSIANVAIVLNDPYLYIETDDTNET